MARAKLSKLTGRFFGGRYFSADYVFGQKRSANKRAEFLRKRGKLARVTRTAQGWQVWEK